jgi:sporulation protein YlmC with PRC-barrel domain
MSLQPIKQVIGMPIVSLDDGRVLGHVSNWTVDLRAQKVRAYTLQREGWRSPQRVVLTMDVVEYGPNMMVVRGPDALVPAEEIVGLTDAIREKVNLIDYTAQSTDGRNIGRIKDFAVELTDGSIQRYYIKPQSLAGAFLNEVILTRSQLVATHDKTVVFHLDARLVAKPEMGDTEPKLA